MCSVVQLVHCFTAALLACCFSGSVWLRKMLLFKCLPFSIILAVQQREWLGLAIILQQESRSVFSCFVLSFGMQGRFQNIQDASARILRYKHHTSDLQAFHSNCYSMSWMKAFQNLALPPLRGTDRRKSSFQHSNIQCARGLF